MRYRMVILRGDALGGGCEGGKDWNNGAGLQVAVSAFSNFPAPARTGKTAHNSHRFLMETPLRQCSLEPQGLIFPDRMTSEIRKRYPRSMQSGTIVPIFTSSQGFRPKLGFGFGNIIAIIISFIIIAFRKMEFLKLLTVKNVMKYILRR